ncbi:hypothetical protein [Bosea sp. NBC_00550]|uniref:hypothetical protein n=1 Tax=Bosea sp. NBC_00550 TaxID=2969621 RepID=UPI002232262B|nr:hypothetical protein [Bosea sp. NBC_00550]UZF94833.1 hypothetical protein NWE53_11985 [Bosea sp. NBC_00550]
MSAEERGLARFMIRFPEFRYRFAQMQDGRFRGICEEYELVSEVITKWSQADHCAMFSLNDYCLLAASIEKDAMTMAKADVARAAVIEKPQAL